MNMRISKGLRSARSSMFEYLVKRDEQKRFGYHPERDKIIIDMRNKGMSLREIGKHFNLTHQRIFQILQKSKEGQ